MRAGWRYDRLGSAPVSTPAVKWMLSRSWKTPASYSLGAQRDLQIAHSPQAAPCTCPQVLHCVMYPRVQFTLPIFAMDMVGFGGRVSLCIADLCPIRDGPQVPTPRWALLFEHTQSYSWQLRLANHPSCLPW